FDSYSSQSSQSSVKSPKTVYAELSRLLKKAIDYAIKADMQQELLNIFKSFIYDVWSKLELKNLTDINNPVVIKYKNDL
ncbi:246_t:CDS:1, partial [Funneliformis geosporum]